MRIYVGFPHNKPPEPPPLAIALTLANAIASAFAFVQMVLCILFSEIISHQIIRILMTWRLWMMSGFGLVSDLVSAKPEPISSHKSGFGLVSDPISAWFRN